MNRRKPTKEEFEMFWSVFEAKQQRRKKYRQQTIDDYPQHKETS